MAKQKISRFAIATRVTLSLFLAGALVTAVNYLSHRHYQSYDFSGSGYFTLSEKTLSFIRSLKEPVKVYLFFNPEHPLYGRVEALLRRYQNAGGDKFVYELIDPYRDEVRAHAIVNQYRLGDQDNVVILDYQNRSKFVDADAMAEMEMPSPIGNETERIKSFKAEEAITSALVSLIQDKPSKVYFTIGHGEGDIASLDPNSGFSELNTRIQRDNILTTNLNLLLDPVIPSDANVIVILGPTTSFQTNEVVLLNDYLKQGGKLLLLLEPGIQSGLDELLKNYGVIADNNYIVGAVKVLGVQRLLGTVPVAEYANHPIVEKMQRTTMVLNSVRSVRALNQNSSFQNVTELVKSSSSYWGETSLNSEDAKFDEGQELKGPLSMAIAVDAGKVGEENVNLSGARLVVIGSSGSFSNTQLVNLPGALDLALNSLNWLLRKETLIGIAPKQPKEFSIGLTEGQLASLALILGIVLPFSVLFLGVGVWWKRRR